jgi:hypothetical protein
MSSEIHQGVDLCLRSSGKPGTLFPHMSNTLLGGDFPDMEKLADTCPVVPTPKKNPKAIEFAFKCSENKWAATNFSIAKFDLTDWPVASAPLLPPSGSQPSSRLSAVSPSIIESRLRPSFIAKQASLSS